MHASEEYILLAEQALKLAKTEVSEARRRAIIDIALSWSRLAQEERSFEPAREGFGRYA